MDERFNISGDFLIEYCDESGVDEVVIPDGVRVIGDYAFAGKSGIKKVVIPDSVENIGHAAFEKCSGLEEVEFGKGIKYIFDAAFGECISLKSIELPDELEYIGAEAFDGCSKLSEISFPNTLKFIGEECFNSTQIKELGLPDELAYMPIYSSHFMWSMDKLEKIVVSENSRYYSTEEGILYSKDGKRLICCPINKSGEINVRDGVEIVESYAFHGRSDRSEAVVRFPESVKSISQTAFLSYSAKMVVLPNSTPIVGGSMFSTDCAIDTLVIPKGVLIIKGELYKYSSIGNIFILNPDIEIPDEVFLDDPKTIIKVYAPESENLRRVAEKFPHLEYIPTSADDIEKMINSKIIH